MFDVGFWELTLVAVIALIVLGPERLPVVARTAGRWAGRARSYARGLTSELQREVDVEGFRQEIDRARESIETSTRDTLDDIETDTRDAMDDIEDYVTDIDEDAPDFERHAQGTDGSNGVENDTGADTDRTVADDVAEYGEAEPFSVERARAEHAQRDRESPL